MDGHCKDTRCLHKNSMIPSSARIRSCLWAMAATLVKFPTPSLPRPRSQARAHHQSFLMYKNCARKLTWKKKHLIAGIDKE